MALSAGRVGVESSQVDYSGRIRGTGHYRHDVAFEPNTVITMNENGILTIQIYASTSESALLVLENASSEEIEQYTIPINNGMGCFTIGVLAGERITLTSVDSASGTIITI